MLQAFQMPKTNKITSSIVIKDVYVKLQINAHLAMLDI